MRTPAPEGLPSRLTPSRVYSSIRPTRGLRAHSGRHDGLPSEEPVPRIPGYASAGGASHDRLPSQWAVQTRDGDPVPTEPATVEQVARGRAGNGAPGKTCRTRQGWACLEGGHAHGGVATCVPWMPDFSVAWDGGGAGVLIGFGRLGATWLARCAFFSPRTTCVARGRRGCCRVRVREHTGAFFVPASVRERCCVCPDAHLRLHSGCPARGGRTDVNWALHISCRRRQPGTAAAEGARPRIFV